MKWLLLLLSIPAFSQRFEFPVAAFLQPEGGTEQEPAPALPEGGVRVTFTPQTKFFAEPLVGRGYYGVWRLDFDNGDNFPTKLSISRALAAHPKLELQSAELYSAYLALVTEKKKAVFDKKRDKYNDIGSALRFVSGLTSTGGAAAGNVWIAGVAGAVSLFAPVAINWLGLKAAKAEQERDALPNLSLPKACPEVVSVEPSSDGGHFYCFILAEQIKGAARFGPVQVH